MTGARNRKRPNGSAVAVIVTRLAWSCGSKRYCSLNPNMGEVMVPSKPRPGSKAVTW